MINNSLLLRTAGNHPLIQVRERSAWVRDFPDVPRSILDASGIPDWWKAGICVGEIATGVGLVVGSSIAGKSSRAPPVHHEGDPRVLLRIEAQCVRRPTPPAKRHRHIGGHGAFGHAEARAAAPLGRIYEHAATTRHQTHHCERSRAIAGSK